ncbi:MAG: kelch repeat-containing protein [Bacteroidia bacterium]
MKIKITLCLTIANFLISGLFSFDCNAQQGEWVWISGKSTSGSVGNFGVQGVPNPTNEPPALYEPCEWIDLDGNLWLFGGKNVNQYFCCDLWKYNINTNIWTWMKGSGVMTQYDPGVYGTIGVPAPNNHPPSCGFGVPCWVDKQGNLWLYSVYNDMWKYDISINMWTCVNTYPTLAPVFGTLGVADSLSNPGSGAERTCTWTDNLGYLWLFGGDCYNIGNSDALWRYDIQKKQWTWMKGSSNGYTPIVYGTQGVESSANTPGARWAYSHWVDNNGYFWFFGGNASMTGVHARNDLWRFNPFTNNWTWMGGGTMINSPGNYGVKCITSPANSPAARFENKAVATDENGNFWMFGGAKYVTVPSTRNDLWMYNPNNYQWVWVSGDSILNPLGSWGIKGVTSPTNHPDGRMGSIMWSDKNGHLYLFGGTIDSHITLPMNDLWKYTIDTACLSTVGIDPIQGMIEWTVHPNPTTGEINIKVNGSNFNNVEINIYNINSELIFNEKEKVWDSGFIRTIDLSKFNDGVYSLIVTTEKGQLTKKIVKY